MILSRLVAAEGRLWVLNERQWTRYVMARLWGSLVQVMPRRQRERIMAGARVVPFSRIRETPACGERFRER